MGMGIKRDGARMDDSEFGDYLHQLAVDCRALGMASTGVDFDDAADRHNAFVASYDELRNTEAVTYTENAALRGRIEGLQAENEGLQVDNDELKARVTGPVSDTFDYMRTRLQNQRLSIESYRKELDEQNRDIAALATQCTNKDNQIAVQAHQLQCRINDYAALNSTVDGLEKRISKLLKANERQYKIVVGVKKAVMEALEAPYGRDA